MKTHDAKAGWHRRTLIRLAGTLGLAALVAPGVAAAQNAVVVAHAAGINGQAVEAILKDYTAETGVKATGITMSDTDYGAKMQLAARTGNVDFDVALGVGSDVFALTKGDGIYAGIDTSGWKKETLAGMQEAKLIGDDYAVSQDTAALMVYGKALADNPPKTWGDFFDTKKYPGNRGMASGGLGVPIDIEYALIASGKDPAKLYPLDYDAAFAVLDKVAKDIVLWDNAPKGIQDLVNGDTVMTWSYAPAALSAIAAGQDIKLAAPPGTAVTRQLGVVMAKGPNGEDAGQAFFAWWFRPENQKKYTELTNYGIVVPSQEVLKQFSPEQSAYMPFSGAHPENYRTLGYDYYSAEGDLGQSNLALTLDRWNQFRAR
ncbi:extracellular solute-binding protein [Jiella sonneratiae]|uniref:Extracellular solute-binding protein n=1 Tax=Jiella sonneratiae TaxID=2816856 RepID=A0ABS3J528_9HYPH|nr:extracellular solute-binding protein [Jiella sonneratiae]MBO0904779.1 extracellular solute-binding protein [Jiella sonneratiae]